MAGALQTLSIVEVWENKLLYLPARNQIVLVVRAWHRECLRHPIPARGTRGGHGKINHSGEGEGPRKRGMGKREAV